MVKIRNGRFRFSSKSIQISCFSGTFGLEVTNTSGTQRYWVRTDRTCFFNGKIFRFTKKLSAQFCLLIFVGLVVIL